MIHADLAVLTDVPHIAPVLEHIRERGGADAASLSAELFMSEPLCRSLLAFCEDNGLAEASGGGRHAITPAGTAALESSRAFIGTEGMWRVYIADHELIRGSAGVVRIDDGAVEAAYMPWIKEGQPPVRDLEEAVRSLEGEKLSPVLGGKVREAVVRSIHGSEKRIESDISLRLRIVLDRGSIRVNLLASRGKGGGRRGRMAPVPKEVALHEASTSLGEAAESLLAGKHGAEWDAENGRILVEYDDLSDEERSSMQKTVKCEDIEIGGMSFDTAEMTAAIFPRTEEDAQEWARHLFAGMATGYVTRKEYERLSGAVMDRLGGAGARMGERASHVPGGARSTARTRLFWLVQAMEDWDL